MIHWYKSIESVKFLQMKMSAILENKQMASLNQNHFQTHFSLCS